MIQETEDETVTECLPDTNSTDTERRTAAKQIGNEVAPISVDEGVVDQAEGRKTEQSATDTEHSER
ncbi:MAG: hypothetical protein A3K19_23970 [Lentisphaerae bacterium RIFOXYB12_FULL_65_16]|nr:MAG: hypothetical protein A3K18_10315 [Lentisphaerae bacterium RIFOXYA12_64_32]OGV89576.1 MAG: hypothetical protein A3K19_23970 [Lentisphaerae bacterium RIFOXYB12_FULL_65_16]